MPAQSPGMRNSSSAQLAIVWLRRDLRLQDNAALHHGLANFSQVLPVFVFDTTILDRLDDRADRRVEFIRQALIEIDEALRAYASRLLVLHGDPGFELPRLAARLQASAVIAARDYEPTAIARDQSVREALRRDGRDLVLLKDHVIFETDEILTGTRRPYSVFTPYFRNWSRSLTSADVQVRSCELSAAQLLDPGAEAVVPTLAQIGFQSTNLTELAVPTGASGANALLADFSERIGAYGRRRDQPALPGPSYLSAHLRFGTLSIRAAVRLALEIQLGDPSSAQGASIWLSELAWRDFYFQILHHHPKVVERAFRSEYDAIAWDSAHDHFSAWCKGLTGYPLVDAAMAQINHSGYMHNRLRMITAAFLVKDLGIDWRRGEAYFARKLIDFDLAANNGGWQWSASTGCDAQPWFRIFNPITQSRRYDGSGRFIRRYLPALSRLPDAHIHAPWLAPSTVLDAAGITLGQHYPKPLVDHAKARERTLARYSAAREQSRLMTDTDSAG